MITVAAILALLLLALANAAIARAWIKRVTA